MADSPAPGSDLPPGPRWPRFAVSVAYMTVGTWLMSRMNKQFGPAFTMRLPGFGPTVTVTDPALAKALFQQPLEAVRGVETNLGQLLGPGSTFGLQGEQHRQHRRLLLPLFHGKRMRAYEDLIEQETLDEIATWPEGHRFAVLPSTMRITLKTIVRAVFGADDHEAAALVDLLPRMVKLGQRLVYLPWLRRNLGPWSPWVRLVEMREQLDTLIGSLIDKAVADPARATRTDVLSQLLGARGDDGTALSRSDIADELFTLLVAGHETTATALAWALERLSRHPDVLTTLVDEIDAGESSLLQATVNEVLRIRPVIPAVARQVAAPSIVIGPWVIPRGYTVAVNIALTHLNGTVYEDAEAFAPDRFAGANPDLYSWIPFGGGNRRCPGAAFATFEMQVVLRTILGRFALVPTHARRERWRSRGVAFGPAKGGRLVVRRRQDVEPRL